MPTPMWVLEKIMDALPKDASPDERAAALDEAIARQGELDKPRTRPYAKNSRLPLIGDREYKLR